MDTDSFTCYLRAEPLDAEPGLEARLQLGAWIDGPGLPANAPPVVSARFAAVDAALTQLAAGTAPTALPPTTDWSSHEWVHFLHGPPGSLSAVELAQLDEAFHFTKSGNAEILAAWFEHTIRAGYAPADAALERFLLHVERRKFVVPLYRARPAAPGRAARARKIYVRARPNYHSVATGTLDALLSTEVG